MGYRIAEFELDTRRELLLGPSGPVPLRPLIYRLLLLLAQKAPAVVGHDELLDTLWGPSALSPGVVPQTISELRRALGDDPQRPRLIATRHRRGYALIASVQATDDAAAAPGGSRLLGARGLLVQVHRVPPDLQPALQAVAASAVGWSMRWPGERLAEGEAAWVLDVAGRRWRLQAPAGQAPSAGTLSQGSALGQVGELLQVVGERCGHGPLGWPQGWAAVAAGTLSGTAGTTATAALLCRTVAAAAQGDYGQALRYISARIGDGGGGDGAGLQALQGWPRYWLALTLAGAGRRADARSWLAGLEVAADPVLLLRAEALAAQLDNRPAETLAALRAASMLVPDDLLLALAALDEQLAQHHWDAAAAQLQRLRPRARADTLAWREVALAASARPLQAGKIFQAAERAAGSASEGAATLPALRVQRVRWHLGRGEMAEAARVLAACQPLDGRLTALHARCLLEQGRAAQAREQFDAAAQRHLQEGWPGLARRARLGALEAQLVSGDAVEALAGWQLLQAEAAAEAEAVFDVELLLLLGRCHTALHHAEQAERLLEQATAGARQQGQVRLAALARHHLGSALALQRRQPARAEACFRLAAEGCHEAGDVLGEVRAQANLALMAERAGRRPEARLAYQDALRLLRPLQAGYEHGRIAYNAGVNERDLGDLAAAAAAFSEAQSQLLPLPGSDLHTMVVATRADLALQMAEPATARALLEAAADAASLSGPLPRSCWHTARARLFDLAGDLTQAEAELDQADALRRSSGVRTSQIDLALRRLCLRLAPGGPAHEALLALERLEAELLRLGEAKYALTAGLMTAIASHEAGEHDKAADKAATVWQLVQRSGTRQQQLLADWALALSAPQRERERRLRALAHDAAEGGFALMATLCRHRAAQAAGQTPVPLPSPIEGALRNAAGVF